MRTRTLPGQVWWPQWAIEPKIGALTLRLTVHRLFLRIRYRRPSGAQRVNTIRGRMQRIVGKEKTSLSVVLEDLDRRD
jgi:hypothetical protein